MHNNKGNTELRISLFWLTGPKLTPTGWYIWGSWKIWWSEHASAYPRCKGRLIFNFPAEEQKGVCTRQQLKCNTCNYKSKTHNLYTETDVQHSLISHCMWVSQNCLQVQLEPCTVSLATATSHLGVDVGDFGPADRVPSCL